MVSTNKTLPNFFVVGAPKAGTTTLYHYLDQHPQIYMSPIKEPNYFATEIRPQNLGEELQEQAVRDLAALQEYLWGPMNEKRFGGMVTEWDDYLRLFRGVKGEKAIGEASVCYLWSKTAAQNIHDAVGRAKIVMILRDPADRAFSQYLEALANGRIKSSFADQIEESRTRKDDKFHLMHPFLELGRYHEQVRRYMEQFGEENILILFYESYGNQLAQCLREVYQFLDVDPDFASGASQRLLEPQVPRLSAAMRLLRKYGVSQQIRKLSPAGLERFLRGAAFRKRRSLVMSREDRNCLIEYYEDDIRKLSHLLHRDLTAWLS